MANLNGDISKMDEKWMNTSIHLWTKIGYVSILPKKEYKNHPFLDDLMIIKKWMNENI